MDNKAEITSLEGLIRLAINTSLINLHTSLPCIVDTVNADGTVDVSAVVKRVRVDNTEYNLPVLPKVPVGYPGTVTHNITFPINKGDEGLLIFSERDISTFLTTGRITKPTVHRKHDIADSIFLPMMLSDQNRPKPQAGEGLVMTEKGAGKISIIGNAINIDGILTINGVLYTAHTHSGVTTGTGISGPVNGV